MEKVNQNDEQAMQTALDNVEDAKDSATSNSRYVEECVKHRFVCCQKACYSFCTRF